jgi:hypothetical protein
MEIKSFEVRDRSVITTVIGIRLTPATSAEGRILARSGFGETPEAQRKYIYVGKLDGGIDRLEGSPADWRIRPLAGLEERTMQIAHQHIFENWDNLEIGAVIDVEFILGNTVAPKASEINP